MKVMPRVTAANAHFPQDFEFLLLNEPPRQLYCDPRRVMTLWIPADEVAPA
jgi:hypothetical protein